MQMFAQPGSSSTRSSFELPVGSLQQALWEEVHYDEQGFNRGYPVEVTMFLGMGEELQELTGQDMRDADPATLATNAYRAAVLTTPLEQLDTLQADTGRLYWQAQECGDVLFHMAVGQRAHGVYFEEIVDAVAREMVPSDHTPVRTFGDLDELVSKYKDSFGIMRPGPNGMEYVSLADNSLDVLAHAGRQYLDGYEQMLRNPRAEGPRDNMALSAGIMLWCLSWVAQFRLQSSLQEIAHKSIEKAVRRKQGGVALMFLARGDER